ncbi:sulfurtransferase [uncultured Eudoraea sp.]|uniref:sulfurtransferase n=1 Tax=uncultured Eudoraea sp. TaxID=1035614 RepID=UPI00260C074B|nr:sulfurtransferase [uncultured Eudoraea sp.]
MSWNRALYILILLSVLFGCKETEKSTEDHSDQWKSAQLIEAEIVSKIHSYPTVKIIDLRPTENYLEGHIPGALSLSRAEMTAPEHPIPGMRALPKQLAATLGSKGIKNTDTLVLYDGRGNAEAARLWCLLYANGFTNSKLLNGGYGAWTALELPIESGSVQNEPFSFEFKGDISQDLWIDTEELHSWLQDTTRNVTIIDTRTHDEYSGKRQKANALRAGHIPGAKRIDWADGLNYHGDHQVKSIEDLQELYERIIEERSDTIVVYCHSGVRSSFTTFVLTQLLDYKNVRNYDGSWTAWSRRPELPIEQDSITQILK